MFHICHIFHSFQHLGWEGRGARCAHDFLFGCCAREALVLQNSWISEPLPPVQGGHRASTMHDSYAAWRTAAKCPGILQASTSEASKRCTREKGVTIWDPVFLRLTLSLTRNWIVSSSQPIYANSNFEESFFVQNWLGNVYKISITPLAY